jgi:hypothetical protein
MTDYKGAGQPGDKAHKHRLDRFYLDAQATGWPTPKNITGGPEAKSEHGGQPDGRGEDGHIDDAETEGRVREEHVPDTGSGGLRYVSGRDQAGDPERAHAEPFEVGAFPPGPNEREFWAAIIERYPGLAPAVDTEIESDFRGVADGWATQSYLLLRRMLS